MANALVIGMGGVGSVIGQKLHSYDAFDRIVLADIDTGHAQRLVSKTKNSRFEVAQINATDTGRLAEFIQERQIAVTLNACTWQATTACSRLARNPDRTISIWLPTFSRHEA
jgi:saccharopine dehydrogenase (NAD+, L-lysine-forming)